MYKLYNNAIKHLNKINSSELRQETVKSKDDGGGGKKHVKNTKELYDLKYIYDRHNRLPILDIVQLHYSLKIHEELEDFLEMLKLLMNIDDKFLSLIEKYEPKYKSGKDYNYIKNTLIEEVGINFNQDFKDIKKSKLVIGLAIEDLFQKNYQRKSAANMYLFFYNKVFSYISNYYENILNSLGDYYISQICHYDRSTSDFTSKQFLKVESAKGKDISKILNVDGNFIFLSYAFNDKFFSFLLYLEALEYNQILYVDWMYSDEINDTRLLKSTLRYYLTSADKLIFLQSIQSELNINPYFSEDFREKQKMIKQWCAWEIGFFYNKSKEGSNTDKYCTHTLKYTMNSAVKNRLKRTINVNNSILEDIKSIYSMKEI